MDYLCISGSFEASVPDVNVLRAAIITWELASYASSILGPSLPTAEVEDSSECREYEGH